jgi:hypothetical protein
MRPEDAKNPPAKAWLPSAPVAPSVQSNNPWLPNYAPPIPAAAPHGHGTIRSPQGTITR